MNRKIFNEEHEMFRDSTRSFLQNEIQPHSDKWHEQGMVDREAYQKARGAGIAAYVGRMKNMVVPVLPISVTNRF